jgi:hypothetical protein
MKDNPILKIFGPKGSKKLDDYLKIIIPKAD